jgi:predicted CopG family antitoxin
MTTITIPKKEYKELAQGKKQLSEVLRLLLAKEIRAMPKKNDLLDLAKLKLRGGPKNLSSRLDFYLYK